MIIAYPLGSNFTNINPFILYYEFSLCCEKVSDNKEFSCGNSKLCCKSQITTYRSNPEDKHKQTQKKQANKQKNRPFYLKTKTKNSKIEIIVNGSVIKQVKKKKILGIIVHEKFTFKSHIKYICTKARKSYGCFTMITMLSPAKYVSIYKSFIRSHLEHCCAAWSPRIYQNTNLKLLESSQRVVLSLILRSFKQ